MAKVSYNNKGKGNGLTPQQFTLKAIKALRKDGYKGIHSVYSGFNSAFREHFQGDPVPITTAMAKHGELVTIPVRGGVMLYLPEDRPESKGNGPAALAKILG